jgi:hypothetical protein
MNLLLNLLILFSLSAHALEVDEKLTARILKTSESRKTLMINRGIEDGLVEGDHAKFIVTAGIVARGVCVKVSPTRSVWSIYRMVNADFIVNDSVMSLKITPPVKITKDESQALVQEDTPRRVSTDPEALGIPLAEGARDLDSSRDNLSSEDLRALTEDRLPTTIVEKNKEIFSFLHISGLTANSKTDVGDQSFNSSQSFYHIGLGGEYYPQRERDWYSRFSLVGGVALIRENTQAYTGASIVNETTEFSFGTNWHPFNLPSQTGLFIPYFHASFNIGSAHSVFKPGTENPTGLETSSKGSTSGFSVGFGYKFYSHQGFGARALLDYYVRNERYQEDDFANKHNKIVGGPRLMLGLSYRL